FRCFDRRSRLAHVPHHRGVSIARTPHLLWSAKLVLAPRVMAAEWPPRTHLPNQVNSSLPIAHRFFLRCPSPWLARARAGYGLHFPTSQSLASPTVRRWFRVVPPPMPPARPTRQAGK